jgi:putative tricarboxylic transport membrane protein
MRLNDALIGGVLLVFAVALAVYSQTFPDIPGQQYGAAVFPTLVAIGFAGSGIVMVVSGMRHHAPLAAWADWGRERHGVRNVVVTIGAVLFYIFASEPLGFVPTMAVVLLVLLRLFAVGWAASVITAILLSVLIHVMFGKYLYVPLPWGVLAPYRLW